MQSIMKSAYLKKQLIPMKPTTIHSLPTRNLPPQSSTDCANLLEYDELLKVCTELLNVDSVMSQVKINQFLQYTIPCQIAFMLIPTPRGTFLKVIGDRILDKAVRIPVVSSKFEDAIFKNYTFKTDELFEKHRCFFTDMSSAIIQSFVCIPITIPRGKTASVLVCLANNKRPAKHLQELLMLPKKKISSEFSFLECQIVREIFYYLNPLIHNKIGNENKPFFYPELHDFFKTFLGGGDYEKSLSKFSVMDVIKETGRLLSAERSSLYYWDDANHQLVGKTFYGLENREKDVCLPDHVGVANEVYKSKKLMNLKHPTTCKMFCNRMDDLINQRTRNVLCLPICSPTAVIAIAEFCNKCGKHFTTEDEELGKVIVAICSNIYKAKEMLLRDH